MNCNSCIVHSLNSDEALVFSDRYRIKLERDEWNETEVNLTQSIIDYYNDDEETRNNLKAVLEIFFILESEIINLGVNSLLLFSSTINSMKYQRYLLVYLLNEMTHSRFYRDLYLKIVMSDKVVDDSHIEELYDKYNNIEVFRDRVSEISNLDSSQLNWKDFARFACLEGIKFMSLFFFIFYYAKRSKYVALEEGNRWVSRDEFIHSSCHINMAHYLGKRDGVSIIEFLSFVEELVSEYVNDEIIFCRTMFSSFENEDLITYIKWLGDRLVKKSYKLCSIQRNYKISIPSFMQRLELNSKESLHETINTSYVKISKLNLGIDKLISELVN